MTDSVARQFRKSAAYRERTSRALQLAGGDPARSGHQRQATLQLLQQQQCVLESGVIAWRKINDRGPTEPSET